MEPVLRHTEKIDIFDGESSIFNDLSGTDADIEVWIALFEFDENVFLDFVVESRIDDESPHRRSNDE